MSDVPRKATDVLLDLESKITTLLSTVQVMNMNIQVVSNKLNEVMKGLEKQAALPQKITVEAVQTAVQPPQLAPPVADPRSIPIIAEHKLPMTDEPVGFRRTSRSESYAGSNDYLRKEGVPPPRNEIPRPTTNANKPPPGRSTGETVPLTPTPVPRNKAASAPTETKAPTEMNTHGIIPVEQRVVDRNGKSVFLADVEIIDLSSGEQVSKSRTNGTGKWMAALSVGEYKVCIRKLESLTKEKVEVIQTVRVDGTQSPLKLAMVIIK